MSKVKGKVNSMGAEAVQVPKAKTRFHVSGSWEPGSATLDFAFYPTRSTKASYEPGERLFSHSA